MRGNSVGIFGSNLILGNSYDACYSSSCELHPRRYGHGCSNTSIALVRRSDSNFDDALWAVGTSSSDDVVAVDDVDDANDAGGRARWFWLMECFCGFRPNLLASLRLSLGTISEAVINGFIVRVKE